MTSDSQPAPPAFAGPLVLRPTFQTYAWGDPHFIPDLFGLPRTGLPHAEAWFGAHPSGPSAVEFDGQTAPLDRLLAGSGDAILGREVAHRFGGLPFLFKVLAAAYPLSIQVHPSRQQALVGFAREKANGVAGTALRNYADLNAKPELFVALTPFQALCGFRPLDEISAALAAAPELAGLVPGWSDGAEPLRALVTGYLTLPDETVRPALAAWVKRLAEAGPAPGTLDAWIVEASRRFGGDQQPDRGLFFFLLLNLVFLQPGEGIFLAAGTLHAYLRGAGVEVMASSDNVLRAGLTPKHVDLRELLALLRFESRSPEILRGAAGERTYPTPAHDFQLSATEVVAGTRLPARTARGPELLFFLAGEGPGALEVEAAGGTATLASGGCCLIPDGIAYGVRASAAGRLMRVSVPPAGPVTELRGRPVRPLAFGTSGLRGLVDDITDLEAYVNTRGFLEYLLETDRATHGEPLALAGDLRPSTDSPDRSIMRAVACAATDLGFQVVFCGRIPTPALMSFGLSQDCASIMVTGSHIPFDRNGIKFNLRSGEVLKEDEAPILRAVDRVRREEYALSAEHSRFDDRGMFRVPPPPLPADTGEAREHYVRRYVDFFPPRALAGMRIAVYQHSAVGAQLLTEILNALGAQATAFGRSTQFIAIDTEDISAERLQQMQVLVDDARARFGALDAVVSTDGDSDRPLVLEVGGDGRVKFFTGDRLGMVVADYLRADAMAVPVTATDAIDRHFAGRVRLVRTRVGSPYVISAAAALEGTRRVGWEANGGFLTFSEIERQGRHLPALPTRDAALPILAALHASRERGLSLGQLFATLPRRFGAAGLIDGVAPESSRLLATQLSAGDPAVTAVVFDGGPPRAVAAGAEREAAGPLAARLSELRDWLSGHFGRDQGFGAITRIEYLDGTRISFASGEVVHIRASGNAPQLRAYLLADDEERARAVVALAVQEPDGILRRLLGEAQQRGHR
jgi:phosphomannomutase